MTKVKMFRKGKLIDSVEELLECRKEGTFYVFWGDKPMHYSFLASMPFRIVLRAILRGKLSKAIRNND